ncbi:MAG: hypothetical protein HQ475_04100 [SAR202 cluster bacterium]|nr:hypothetical protein [SAR202 cluster bacterium]
MTLAVERPINGLAAVATPEPVTKRRSRDRQPFTPEPVEATIFWWWTEEGRSACMENQFSTLPATPIRFRCLGTSSSKFPKRYRVDLAQAMDWMPQLDRRELKSLGKSLAEALSRKLGVEVAAISPDVIDTELVGA